MKFIGLTCLLALGVDSAIVPTTSFDPYCTSWDDRGRCTSCAFRTVLISRRCNVVSDLCKNWGKLGRCTACYRGYKLARGACS